jgi:hypothetical protein
MKPIILYLLLFLSLTTYSQHFNGNYTSGSTSYKDDVNADNNFREDTKFNIAVFIDESIKDGRVVIQDPRLPNKLLIYKVIARTDYTEVDGRWIAIYDCIADHLDNQNKETLTFYISKQNELNLMVSNSTSSQMFFNLNKQ